MEAIFLPGPAGRLFAIHHPAAAGKRTQPLGLVYVAPFAEEMNRARRMAALQARRLASLGIDVLLLDLFGTGDSAGEFGEADWGIWRQDVGCALDWLSARIEGDVGLWGLRLGALLSADVAAAQPERIARMVLWQPALSGDRHLTQFLRLHLAANLASSSERQSTKELRTRLISGETLEVAGYRLAPSLARAMSPLKLDDLLQRLPAIPIDWLEVAPADKLSLGSASRDLVETLRQRGNPVVARAVEGDPFWTIQEITSAPELLRATDAALTR